MLERLWAGWRTNYVTGLSKDDGAPQGEGSVFERILNSGLPDSETFIVWRGQWCFALLNLYPYGSGHMLILPNRRVATLGELTAEESAELWAGVQMSVAAIEQAYTPDGVNVGLNMGKAAGAGIPDHLHFHALPRWASDSNFMTSIAESRVLPETLESSWTRLCDAFPT